MASVRWASPLSKGTNRSNRFQSDFKLILNRLQDDKIEVIPSKVTASFSYRDQANMPVPCPNNVRIPQNSFQGLNRFLTDSDSFVRLKSKESDATRERIALESVPKRFSEVAPFRFNKKMIS